MYSYKKMCKFVIVNNFLNMNTPTNIYKDSHIRLQTNQSQIKTRARKQLKR